MKKLGFLLDWDTKEMSQLSSLEDGMFEAIRLLSLEWDVRVYCIGFNGIVNHKYFPIHFRPNEAEVAKDMIRWNPHFILTWADFTRPTLPLLQGSGIPIGMAFTGGISLGHVPDIDVFFVENKSYRDQFLAWGKNVHIAFGVNDRIFKPIQQPKVWDTIFPATFASWKRHKLFAEATKGYSALACGYMYTSHEQECYLDPQILGVGIAPHIPGSAVAYFMNMARTCLITSNTHGGSQRAVLEAMACNIPVIVMEDSDKTSEYVRESGAGIICKPEVESIHNALNELILRPIKTGRDYIDANYTAWHYKEAIKKGFLTL